MVAFVATAISADRLSAAAPALRPQMSEAARKLAGRLVISFRRTVPSVRLVAFRRDERPQPASPPVFLDRPPVVHCHELSPFQHRLPPPVA